MTDDSGEGNVVEEEAQNTDHSVLLQKRDSPAACKAAHGHDMAMTCTFWAALVL